jgi:hypothetical protein
MEKLGFFCIKIYLHLQQDSIWVRMILGLVLNYFQLCEHLYQNYMIYAQPIEWVRWFDMFGAMLGASLKRKYLYYPGPGWVLFFYSKNESYCTSGGFGD